MNRSILLVFVLVLTTSSLIMVKPVCAESIPTPSVPEFTLKFSEQSSDTPITYSTNPYTGENVTIPASHYRWKTIEVTIKNQPASYDFYYNIRIKGHFSEGLTSSSRATQNSSGPYTVVTYVLNGTDYPPSVSELMRLSIPEGGKVDFQLQAVTGYETRAPPTFMYTFVGAESDWSDIQTLDIPSPSSTLTASLSESASALYYGNTINFTVSANGGVPPYTYAWYMDGQSSENNSSPYFSMDSQSVGSHHMYVQVTDADNNSANTLTVEFNVLPVSSASTSLSPTLSNSPTQPEFTQYTGPTLQGDYADYTLFYLFVGIIALVIIITAIYIIVYFKKHHRQN